MLRGIVPGGTLSPRGWTYLCSMIFCEVVSVSRTLSALGGDQFLGGSLVDALAGEAQGVGTDLQALAELRVGELPALEVQGVEPLLGVLACDHGAAVTAAPLHVGERRGDEDGDHAAAVRHPHATDDGQGLVGLRLGGLGVELPDLLPLGALGAPVVGDVGEQGARVDTLRAVVLLAGLRGLLPHAVLLGAQALGGALAVAGGVLGHFGSSVWIVLDRVG